MDRKRVDYDQVAAAYDARYAVNQLAGIGRALLEVIAQYGARRILEVGCGTGHWLAEVTPHAEFTAGVDPSPAMLAEAKKKPGSPALVIARANGLPFAGSCFDLIFAVNAIHHFDDPCGFISDAAHLLRPGGALAILGIDPRLIRRRYFYEYFDGTYERDLQRFPAIGDVVNWMAAAGFNRIEYRIAERYQSSFRGDAVLADPFLKKNSNSLLGLLSDTDYERGLRRIEAAIADGDAEFTSDITFPLIVGSF